MRRIILAAIAVILGSVLSIALPASVKRPAGKMGTVVVPDHFLRRWDPVTIFYPQDTGPAAGGPEDHAERLVKLTPSHPGAFTWLDARTLQFKPAEPWPPLARFTWKAGSSSTTLTTLMSAPAETIPANNEQGLDPIESLTLTFPEPLDLQALSQMLTVELRPLPGIKKEEAQWLTRDNFDIKEMERKSRSDVATYVVGFHNPIPNGMRVIVHLRLSLDDDAAESFLEITFATAEPFRILSAGCYNHRYPVAQQGSRYTPEQVIRCDSSGRTVIAEFSSTLRQTGPVEGRNLIRFSPAVENLTFVARGRILEINGDFSWDTLYRMTLVPIPLTDAEGRALLMNGESEMHLYFPRRPSYLKLSEGEGILERFGPQMAPVQGRGQERLDLRIFPIDPLDRSFWPFPDHPVSTDESQRPPGPGEEPKPYADTTRAITEQEMIAQISNLTSPAVSTLVSIPLRKEGSSAAFGLNLEPHLTAISGKQHPGTYLVGIRRLDTSNERSWMRIQVSDLSLSTAEEPLAVRFAVTSLSTAQPVAGATIRIEGIFNEKGKPTTWIPFFEGITDAAGTLRWKAPGPDLKYRKTWRVQRIVVSKDNDTLVLDPTRAPERYADNQWFPSADTWLQWAFESLIGREAEPQRLVHLFTERPVYRPGEDVHIKGYLRSRDHGKLSNLSFEVVVVVDGPGGLQWRYPATFTEFGSFYQKFSEANIPTGEYTAHLENKKRERFGLVSFRVEAYRIPTFEVQLHSDDRIPLDQEFEVRLTANYYAGGSVAGQNIQWRVTQFPYTWAPKDPKGIDGFLYSSDGRFSSNRKFESTPRLEKQDTTDDKGSATLLLNPAIEPTAQPRSYVIEATVTGPDDQTVTATKAVRALPPFVLGLKVPRYLEHATAIEPQVIVCGPDDKLIAGKQVTVRLLNRQWHSLLRESDFSDGVARYATDVMDEKVYETTVTSETQPVTVRLPIQRSGVYVVELEAQDRLERAQVISVDLYAGGDQPVTWAKPVSPVFSVAMDREEYNPGDSATLVLKSPYQQAAALGITEATEGNRYEWIPVKAGVATFTLPIENTYAPQIPVHFLLLRGRIPGTFPIAVNQSDLGKPSTMAATAWIKVNPVDNRVDVKLDYPQKARPAQKIEVKIQLATPQKTPLPGEVTLWLVDQGVLALGKEQRLDPLPDFIPAVKSRLDIHDSRNMAFGYLPFSEAPGGDQGEEEAGILERATVRKNFKTVPYYNPNILVGPDGIVSVTVELPDNLTNFKIRAKAVSGSERFGYATGQLAVRLPVIVQPALPRFVRPGDSFTASAIGRIVEGEGGKGAAEIKVTGVTLRGPSRQDLSWIPNRAERIDFPVEVPTPPYNKLGNPPYREVSFLMGVERASDGAKDAFEVRLPILEDRPKITLRTFQELLPNQPVPVPKLTEPARPGTVKRTILISGHPGLVRMAAGLDFLLEYPYGCTEQKLSRARAFIALKKFRDLLHQRGTEAEIHRAVNETLDWIPAVIDSNGLCAYWPGSRGSVSLTAWVVQFLVEASKAGFPVDEKIFNTLTASLERALRSDYGHFITGEAFEERTWALAALADAGKFNPAYASELSRKTEYLDLEATAMVLRALSIGGDSATTQLLSQRLWDGVIVRLHQQQEIYGGLQDRVRSPLILPSETRTVAEMTRSLSLVQAKNPKLQILIQALVTLGQDDGWGSTNANAAALLALSELLQPPFEGVAPNRVEVRFGNESKLMQIGPGDPTGYFATTTSADGEVMLQTGGKGSVVVRAETTYVPSSDGSHVAAAAGGLVVTREMLRIRNSQEPADRTSLVAAGTTAEFSVGDVIEEHVQIVNPKDRNYVAVVVPLAAGMEPLNPNLATAPPEARSSGQLTLQPTYAAYLDDQAAFYYNSLPKGTYDFYFRTRATISGSFIQPAAHAEMMYDGAVRGNSFGARVNIQK